MTPQNTTSDLGAVGRPGLGPKNRGLPVSSIAIVALFLAFPGGGTGTLAQTPVAPSAPVAATQNGVPRQSGTVKAVTPADLVLTTAAGQDYAVTVPGTARILIVPPGSKDLGAAQPGTMADIAGGDRVLVSGTAGDSGSSLTATRVIVMKSTAIAANHAAEEAAWTGGAGGIVRSIDAGTGVITLATGSTTLLVDTSARTTVRRYAGGSVRFEDAVASTVAEIRPGDQLRARGQRSPDSTTVVADEIVTGSFSNFSGILSAIDTTAGTVTLRDLASKRVVTVAVSGQTNLRRMPAGMDQMMGPHAPGQGGAQGDQAAGGAPGPGASNGGHTAGRQPENQGSARPGGSGGGAGRSGGASPDLSRMVNRMPTETLAGLKGGDAVMIVASNNPESGRATAITLLAGVEQILAAHPSGGTTLSPWTLGGGGAQGEAGGSGEGSGPR